MYLFNKARIKVGYERREKCEREINKYELVIKGELGKRRLKHSDKNIEFHKFCPIQKKIY